jgi:predicted transcriptional regulator
MEFDIYKIGAESAKLHGMTKEQSQSEVQYKMAQKMLDILLRRGIVTEEECQKIDSLNRQSFSPQLAKVYA